jgi:hypothetical protein
MMSIRIPKAYFTAVPAGVLAFAAALCGQVADLPGRELVVLEMVVAAKDGCGPLKLDFVRSLTDGTSSQEPFRVPPGRALVITDVDWHYHSGGPNLVQVLRLSVQNLTEPGKARRVFESVIRLDVNGVGGTSEHMTTGFAVSPDARVCLEVVPGPIGSPMRLSKVLMRGYLTRQH